MVTASGRPSGTATTTKSCYDAADRLTSTTAGSIGTNVTYDTRGRTTTLGTDSYAYDQTDRCNQRQELFFHLGVLPMNRAGRQSKIVIGESRHDVARWSRL